jgi:HlyD family secretion protein
VQVRALVDETDVGKVAPGLPATITVDAFAARPFEGTVLKIEPMATVNQNVTMFPVLVRIANPGHVLKPGMNTEVEIHIGRGEDVLAIPYHALRTQRDVASAATVLGLAPDEVQEQIAAAREAAPATETARPESARAEGAAAADEPAQGRGRRRGGSSGGRGNARGEGAGRYIAFVLRDGKPSALEIRTGLTDLDYVEVAGGLAEADTVLVLPSASLLQSQREMQERVQRMTGGGGLPGVQQQSPNAARDSGTR